MADTMANHTFTHPRLIGVGVGPGDPELLTVKAIKAIQSADVIAFHARTGGTSTARSIAESYFLPHHELELLEYPVTTGITDHPGGYAGAMADFYAHAHERLAQHLRAGKTVAVLALGDPMLYSSYQHLHRSLAEEFPAEIIPGIPSITAAADFIAQPLCEDDEILTILPGTLDKATLTAKLKETDSAVVMKLGRTFDKVKEAMVEAGVAERAYVAIRVGMHDQRSIKLLDADAKDIPYFAVAVLPSRIAGTTAEPTKGEVVVVGLGPGADKWTTPEVLAELKTATDIVGYSTYVNRVPEYPGQRRHPSDNKVEAERALMALDLARRGRKVAVVSSGDPGVFAMAAAVLEVAEEDQWRDVPVRIVPGMTAAQAVASRVGAPLGHDFGMISLSDRLKPFSIVEKRVRALAGADMAFAVYNPASKERRWQVARLRDIVAEYQAPTTPVIVARAVGSDGEKVTVTTVAEFDPEIVDMRTMVIMGASTTRCYEDGFGALRVFTSRYYDAKENLY
ncbi:precorrin-3B C(17)-methyltransferase [Corynebacterium felinum]|uniref:Precorrin-2 C20-methyltransferase/precorrin-3B C17-methyltransferase n=1 Tax=Corynebacterium felinum TaxID=131318 RepID=A0ABU2BCB8_9CORY|nr:precorrin-3B C(17)-methyltransferase [Corynebacterium felinum]MDF5819502.1 precorrin-3B C(17)-methyltransferase [Corynebacterium felinum]MDR7355634.1 precorrin-2 C20-methyltransferase/precorrin-3B C17-methyltransferase [Corynebacterium felinum]WJY94986.1 Precorrin-3B C(17)-methyltransferase [Corynebacterium felinum]